MALAVGTYVNQHIRLVRPLGQGGMGSVWVAHHEMLDAEVAVKFVSGDLGEQDETIIARFKREAALSAKLKSPHVVKTFDHGVMDDGRPYIVMELLDGETLGKRLKVQRRLPPRDVSVVVTQVAQVLEEAHGLGVVHRDIKPDNVFLLSSGYDLFVKVLDFGIAKQTSMPKHATVTDTGAIVGTPEYMSPEQLLSTSSADFKADLWALGVLAYHALTGHVPFQGETLPALSLKICGGRFEPPSSHLRGLPAALDAWFERAFSPKAEERFGGVRDMASSFRRIVTTGSAIDEAAAPTEPDPRTPADPLASSPEARRSDPPRSGSTEADPEESGQVAIRGLGAADTLASEPEDELRRPVSAGMTDPDDSGVHRAVGEASADQSGRRQAVSDTLLEGHSPTFSGAAANLRPAVDAPPHNNPRRRLLGAALAALVLAFVGALLWSGRTNPDPPPAPSPAASGSSEPMASASAAPSSTAAATSATAAATGSASATGTEPSTAPPASATGSARPSASANPTGGVPSKPWQGTPATGTSAPTANASAQPTANPCENPYIVNSDGTLTVRPACL